MRVFRHLAYVGIAVLFSASHAAAQGVAPVPTPEELVWGFYSAWNARDYDAALPVLAPDVRWVDPRLRPMPFGGTRRGHDEIRELVLAPIEANWDGFTIAVDRVVRNGSQVFVSGTVTGFGRKSGRLLHSPYGAVWTISDGVATRVTTFFLPERWLASL
jgi:ketosteroid isomerase-like protein